MPAGVSWGQYLAFSAAAMLSMLAGSQIVHLHYHPLQDIDKYIISELQNLPEDAQMKIKKELQDDGLLK